jgi:diguanylate cyclase (GGDEF)-like protein/PAS domain S-box-containing protein
VNLAYAAILIVAGFIALTAAGVTWSKRSVPGGSMLFIMLASLVIWNWMYAGFWLTTSPIAKIVWMDLAYIGVVVSTPAFLFMALEFTGRCEWLTRRMYLLLGGLSLLTLLILWTDPLHHLFFGTIDITDPANALMRGPWFHLHVFFVEMGTLAATIILLSAWMRSIGLFHKQVRILLIGIAFPWISHILSLLGVHPLPGLDLTPIALSLTGLLFTYGSLMLGVLDLVHISRHTLVEFLEDAIVVVDLRGRVMDINAHAMQWVSPTDSLIGKSFREVFARYNELTRLADLSDERVDVMLRQSPPLHLEARVSPLHDKKGQVVGRLIAWRDVTVAKQAENEMRIFRHAVDQNPSMILITDPEGRIEYVNRQFTHLTGFTLEEVRGKTPRILRSGETPRETYESLWDTIKRGETWESEIFNRKKNDDRYWAHELIAPVQDANGNVTHFIAMQQDITERKHTESELLVANTRLQFQLEETGRLHNQLREESIRDGLTRLFNRRYMEETLDRELSRADRDPRPISVVMMDVDLFKSINDTYGHQAGDTVLQTLGTLLLENTRISDIACRYGGDEMLVVMPGASLADAIHRAEEWRAAFSMLEFSLREGTVRASLSLGVASFPEHAHSPIELLVAADKALYKAKNIRNTVATYDPASMSNSNNRSDNIR